MDTEFHSVCRTQRNKSKYYALQKYSEIGEMQSFSVPPNGPLYVSVQVFSITSHRFMWSVNFQHLNIFRFPANFSQ